MNNTQIIKEYLASRFLIEFGNQIDDSSNLFDLGLIDSYGFIELSNFLQDTFNISISEEELMNGNLTSLFKMINLVEKKIES